VHKAEAAAHYPPNEGVSHFLFFFVCFGVDKREPAAFGKPEVQQDMLLSKRPEGTRALGIELEEACQRRVTEQSARVSLDACH